jgi:hypothetical protein
VVDLRAGDRTWRKQLVAGDGYMASNERLLQFGLGEAAEVTELMVHWPSGTTSTVRRLPAEGTLELVESASNGIRWRGPETPTIVDVTTGRDDD